MIVSPVISQKNYIINKDTIVGYTKQENRKIAILFLQGDSCKDVSNTTNQISDSLYKQVSGFKLSNSALTSKNTLLQTDNNTLTTNLNKSIDATNKAKRGTAFWRTTTLLAIIYGIIKSL